MAILEFYNSLSKKVEEFIPTEPGKVSIYNCGPTVYKRQHIGNMRRYLFADVLRRSLELFGYEVKDVTNITDVGHLTGDDTDTGEDKLEKQAREEKKTPQQIADEQTALFFADLKQLNILPARIYPKATKHIQAMQDLIKVLLEKGSAYKTATGIYFDVTSFPTYGALSGNTLEQLNAGARIEVRQEKKHPADFALWIFDNEQAQLWDSPWGKGYPGWHIECSAMSLQYLDAPIDIHTGGIDNKFPHHENEIAQSEAGTGKKFVKLWLHNGHLQIQGKKMAKREGELITLDTLREKGVSPLAFRLFIFSSHYRMPVDFSWEILATFSAHLSAFKQLLRQLRELGMTASTGPDKKVLLGFENALADDLNTPQAWALFLQYVKETNQKLADKENVAEHIVTLKAMDKVIGVLDVLGQELEAESVPKEVLALVEQRDTAKVEKKYDLADSLRVNIEELGYKLEDTAHGTRVVKT